MSTIAVIQYFPNHGYEVWITDKIEIGEGMGDVLNTRQEAVAYAEEHRVPVLDLSEIPTPLLEGEALREFFQQYLILSPIGGIVAIRNNN